MSNLPAAADGGRLRLPRLRRDLALLCALPAFALACESSTPSRTQHIDAEQLAPLALTRRVASERAPAGPALDRPALYNAIADQLASELRAAGVPGAGFAIAEAGAVQLAVGLGVKQAGHDEPVTADTRFRIGSITKAVTSAVANRLVLEGTVALDAPITEYVPDLALHAPHDPRQISLRKLLSHTAGVPDVTEPECDPDDAALGAWFSAHPDLTLWSPPGRLWNYSNLGYSLAGLVLERASGVPFTQLVQTKLFEPLGLASMSFDTKAVLEADHATGLTSDPDSPDSTRAQCALENPCGFLWSSAPDIARFALSLLGTGDAPLDPAIFAEMSAPVISTQAPPDAFYGLGLFTQQVGDLHVIFHDGAIPGFQAALAIVPERGLAVALLINGDTYAPLSGVSEALRQLLELSPGERPIKDWTTPPSDWLRYVGVYSEPDDPTQFPAAQFGAAQVILRGGKLAARVRGNDSWYALTQVTRDSWTALVDGEPVPLTFWRNAWGRAEYIATRAGVLRRSSRLQP